MERRLDSLHRHPVFRCFAFVLMCRCCDNIYTFLYIIPYSYSSVTLSACACAISCACAYHLFLWYRLDGFAVPYTEVLNLYGPKSLSQCDYSYFFLRFCAWCEAKNFRTSRFAG